MRRRRTRRALRQISHFVSLLDNAIYICIYIIFLYNFFILHYIYIYSKYYVEVGMYIFFAFVLAYIFYYTASRSVKFLPTKIVYYT